MEGKELVMNELKELSEAVLEFKTKTGADVSDVQERIGALEKHVSKSGVGHSSEEEIKSIGKILTDSEGYKDFSSRQMKHSGKIAVGSFFKTTILNTPGLNQPLVQALRVPGMIAPGQQRLTVRDLLTVSPTSSNMVEFCKETSSTNAAAPQGKGTSPLIVEGIAKAESAIGFTLENAPVVTIAHWIPVSRQVLDDAPALQGYVNGRMTYFLKLVEEQQLLSGSGAGGDLDGLIPQATAYDTGADNMGDTKMDTISHAITQVDNSNYEADAVVVNNLDWELIRLIKTTGTSSSGEYIFADPRFATVPQLWGKTVVPTKSMAQGHFLVGAFAMGATLWDRQQASVEVSREHSDFFTRNLAAILCEERLALTVFRNDAFRYGAFPS